MEAKQAAEMAIKEVTDLFGDQDIRGVFFEEIDTQRSAGDKVWLVTVGFRRGPGGKNLVGIHVAAPRLYKVVRINDRTGQVEAIKNRPAD